MTYSELLKAYKPMILHLLKRLSIYRNYEEYFQTACIALWEASEQYNPSKGPMDAYFYLFIKGRLMNEMTRQNRFLQREELKDMSLSEGISHEGEKEEGYDWADLISSLTPNQKKWVIGYAFQGLSIAEIACKERVTPAAVKSWRRAAVQKLRVKINNLGKPY
ncbi:sigma-70 family RNA polymerase sigma factor [Metabacillus sp. 84]|uniref:sigma-70 family RNA polymerase sigma factor n=1 Tax=Metabacillus sp. 84 TaxID=3404705 RepID=UPI003CF4D9BD